MRKENMYLITGILSMVWSFLFSIAAFKIYTFISSCCNNKRLGIAFFTVTVLLGLFVFGIHKKEEEKSEREI